MQSLINLVKLSQENHPEWGMYLHICRAVRGTGVKREQINSLFNRMMPLDEYDKPEKKELIDYLVLQAENIRLV